jgi:hypothetical protein
MDLTRLGDSFSRSLKHLPSVPLLKPVPDKPLDTGDGLISVSIGKRGEILSLGTYRTDVGYIVIHGMPQFPVSEYGNTSFVRSYRRRLASLDSPLGFGLVPVGLISSGEEEADNIRFCYEYRWVGGIAPIVTVQADRLSIEIITFPGCPKGTRVYQVMLLTNQNRTEAGIRLQRGGVISVNRASYGELTEGGPIPPPPVQNAFSVTPCEIKIANPNLRTGVSFQVYSGVNQVISCSPVLINGGGQYPLEVQDERILRLPPHSEQTVLSVFAIIPVERRGSMPEINCDEILQAWKRFLNKPAFIASVGLEPVFLNPKTDSAFPQPEGKGISRHEVINYLINRNVDYILSCCAVPVRSGTQEHTCLLTDHQILPLSWNRDAFYQTRLLRTFLLRRGSQLQDGQKDEIRRVIRSHLLWTFEIAERVDGFWGRSYTPGGQVKDRAFQLDQQCYPLLELISYLDEFSGDDLFPRLLEKITSIVGNLLALKGDETWLLRTEETPADDRIGLAYHFSSEILWWYLCKNLHRLNLRYSFSRWDFARIAQSIMEDIDKYMVVESSGQFCYATDLATGYRLYHDANDLPTVFAPDWGFCSPRDPVWLKTMEFAFSEANHGGYYSGPFGGLGSVHTPSPWPLGEIQRLIFSRLVKDWKLYEVTLNKLISLAQSDGLFSEAVSAVDGQVVSRHWFSWPGALLSTELLAYERYR